jgi:hypothetical protein
MDLEAVDQRHSKRLTRQMLLTFAESFIRAVNGLGSGMPKLMDATRILEVSISHPL